MLHSLPTVPASSDGGARAFRPTADPAFLWRGPQYEVALTLLRAAVVGDGGLLVLTGPPGTGKTVSTQSLTTELQDAPLVVGRVLCPSFEDLDFVRMVALAFGLPARWETRQAFLDSFARFAADARASNQRLLLVIDEAQMLSPAALAGIRALLPPRDRSREEGPSIAVLLAGHPELLGKLREVDLEPDVSCRLHPLSRDQVEAYIGHRLGVVGITANRFTPESVRQIWISSGGIPRSINALCYCALTRHSQESRALVTSATVLGCAEELARAVARPDTDEGQRAAERIFRLPRWIGLKTAVAAAAMITAIVLSVVALRALPVPESRLSPATPTQRVPASKTVPSSQEQRRSEDRPGVTVAPDLGTAVGNPASLPRAALTPEPSVSAAPKSPAPRAAVVRPVEPRSAAAPKALEPKVSEKDFDASRVIDWVLAGSSASPDRED